MWDPKRMYEPPPVVIAREAVRNASTRPVVTAPAGPEVKPGSTRRKNLWVLGYRNYRAYTSSALWKAIRAKVKVRSGRRCEFASCGQPSRVVHHVDYELPTLRGEALDRLIDSCGTCHDSVHDKGPKSPKHIRKLPKRWR